MFGLKRRKNTTSSLGMKITDVTGSELSSLRSEILKQQLEYLKARSHYDAAESNRLRDDWSTAFDVPYNDLKEDLQNLIARSRREISNNGIAQGIIKTIVSNVIGCGMWPKPVVCDESGAPVKEINRALEQGWERFVEQFDVTGHSDFYRCQAVMLETEIVSGTVLLNRTRAPKGSFLNLAYQIFEPDRLDTFKDILKVTINENDPARQVLHGIAVDEYYRPVRYYIKGINKGISAEYMFHHYIRHRPEQLIGVPWLHASLPDLWDYRQLKEDSLTKSRILADIALWAGNDGNNWLGAGQNANESFAWEPGQIIRTKQKPEVIQGDDSVGEILKPMMKLTLLDACSGAGISYMSVSRDMDGVNFAASRTNLTEDRRYYRFIQDHETKLYQRIYNDYVKQMVIENKVPGLNAGVFQSDPWRFTRAHWQTEGWDWVDPTKDAESSVTMLTNGMTNFEQECGKRGVDWRDNFERLAEQQKYAENLGLKVPIFTENDISKFTNENKKLQPKGGEDNVEGKEE